SEEASQFTSYYFRLEDRQDMTDILLAQTDPPHNLAKSDLEDTLNLSKLTPRQRKAVEFPLPIHPFARKLLMLSPFTTLASSIPMPLIKHPTESLEQYFKVEATLACKGSDAGAILINDFFSNTVAKREIKYPVDSPLSKVVDGHSVFNTVADDFED